MARAVYMLRLILLPFDLQQRRRSKRPTHSPFPPVSSFAWLLIFVLCVCANQTNRTSCCKSGRGQTKCFLVFSVPHLADSAQTGDGCRLSHCSRRCCVRLCVLPPCRADPSVASLLQRCKMCGRFSVRLRIRSGFVFASSRHFLVEAVTLLVAATQPLTMKSA